MEPNQLGEMISMAVAHGVNRLLIGLGQIITAAMLLMIVAVLGAESGHFAASNAAILAMGFTAIGYALQLCRMTAIMRGLTLAAVGASWVAGAIAVIFLVWGMR
jgi:hypothetical protein